MLHMFYHDKKKREKKKIHLEGTLICCVREEFPDPFLKQTPLSQVFPDHGFIGAEAGSHQ